MKRFYVCLCLVFLFTGNMGCGAKGEEIAQEERVSIVLLHSWGTMSEGNQAMRNIYEDFMTENPDIELQMIAMPSSEDVEEKVRKMLLVGKVPNLIYTGGAGMNTLYPFMVRENYVVDMMPYIARDEAFKESIPEQMLHAFLTEEGGLYTVTDTLNLSGYWYNMDMFENAGVTQIPSTWEEFEECCRKISDWAEGINYDIVPFHMDTETAVYFSAACAAGSRGNMASAEDNFLGMMRQVKSVGSCGRLEDSSYTGWDNIRSFNVGHCAIYAGGLWMEGEINPDVRAAYAPFPSASGESVGLYSVCPGFLMGNVGDEAQKEACARFIQYMLSAPVQERILLEAGLVPSSESVDVELAAGERDRMRKAYESIINSDRLGEVPENYWNKEILSGYREKVLDYLSGAISEEEFLSHINGTDDMKSGR